jgi:hypothetical protein
MECQSKDRAAGPEASGTPYEPPAVEWEEPFDPVAASDPLNPGCEIDPEACH